MKNSRRYSVETNAGSKADIAFLQLIPFLVTAVIPKDKGTSRTLPGDCPPNVDCNAHIKQRILMTIFINSEDRLMVEDELVSISK